MTKINRVQLKGILKECIKELIKEGAFNAVIKESLSMPQNRQATNTVAESNSGIWGPNGIRRPAANDLQVSNGYAPTQQEEIVPQNQPFASVGQLTPNQRLQELARVTAQNSAGGNVKHAKMMESIFADTAMTTLQKQLGVEGAGGGGMYVGEPETAESIQAEQAQLQALNGGQPMNHWAKLAFGAYNK